MRKKQLFYNRFLFFCDVAYTAAFLQTRGVDDAETAAQQVILPL